MGEIIEEEDLTPMIIFRSIGRGTQEGNDWEELEAALIVAKQQSTKRKIPPSKYDSLQEDIRLIEKKGKFSYGEVMDCGDSISFVEPLKQLDLLQVPVLEAHKVFRQVGWQFQWYKAVATSKSRNKVDAWCSGASKGDAVGMVYVEILASQSTIWFKADGMMFNTTAKLVANAIELVKSYIKWNRFPNLICNDTKVSRSISRFVLSILDLDDICNTEPNKKQSEYRSLFCKLDPLVEDHRFSRKEINGIYMDALRYWTVKKQKRAMSCIAQELLGAEAFAGLNEVDVCSLIKFDMTPACSETSVIDWTAPYFSGKGKVTKEITDEMENFVPLKAEYKVQLNLEAAKMKCFRVIDCLFVEACKGFITKDSFEALKTLLNGSSDRARRSLSQFLKGLHMGLMRFVNFKKYMIVAYQEAVLYPLINGPFGALYDKKDELYREFDDEVMEVMKIADHERRMRRDRFIGVDNDFPPEMPAFKIYDLAGQCATHFENEMVSLHHLALAAISVKLGDPTILHDVEHFEGLSVQKDKLDAAVVSGAALNYSGGDITHYETLIDAILDGGLEVPDIR